MEVRLNTVVDVNIGDIKPGICSSCIVGGAAPLRAVSPALSGGELGIHCGDSNKGAAARTGIGDAPRIGEAPTTRIILPGAGLGTAIGRDRSAAGGRGCPIDKSCISQEGPILGETCKRCTGVSEPAGTASACATGAVLPPGSKNVAPSGELCGPSTGETSSFLVVMAVEIPPGKMANGRSPRGPPCLRNQLGSHPGESRRGKSRRSVVASCRFRRWLHRP